MAIVCEGSLNKNHPAHCSLTVELPVTQAITSLKEMGKLVFSQKIQFQIKADSFHFHAVLGKIVPQIIPGYFLKKSHAPRLQNPVYRIKPTAWILSVPFYGERRNHCKN